jgi:hypothetical protein
MERGLVGLFLLLWLFIRYDCIFWRDGLVTEALIILWVPLIGRICRHQCGSYFGELFK